MHGNQGFIPRFVYSMDSSTFLGGVCDGSRRHRRFCSAKHHGAQQGPKKRRKALTQARSFKLRQVNYHFRWLAD